jgi:hypothetical protein
MSTNVPALKKIPELGAQKDGKRHLTTRIYLYSFFSWNGEMRGVRWRVLSPWAHNAGAAYKSAGPTTQDIRGKNFLPGRHPGVRRVVRGLTLQDDPLPDHAGRVGGEGTGDSTTGGVLQLLGGRVGKVLNHFTLKSFFTTCNLDPLRGITRHHSTSFEEKTFFFFSSSRSLIFYVFALKCLFLKGFQAENGIFALFSTKIRTWQIMPLKVGFIYGFRGLLTD